MIFWLDSLTTTITQEGRKKLFAFVSISKKKIWLVFQLSWSKLTGEKCRDSEKIKSLNVELLYGFSWNFGEKFAYGYHFGKFQPFIWNHLLTGKKLSNKKKLLRSYLVWKNVSFFLQFYIQVFFNFI